MDMFTYYKRDGVERVMVPVNKDEFVVKTTVQADAIVANCAVNAELHPVRSVNKLLAKAPLTVYEKSLREGWDDNDWKKWLNDPDNKAFRVWKGRV